jgi:RNA polymerase sigma factor (sigma-70 family)
MEPLPFVVDFGDTMRDPAARALDARFEEVLRTHRAALRRVAASYERDRGRQEDLFQDVCLAIWRALPRFRGEASERTFVFRIAHNRGIAHSTRRRPAALDLAGVPEVADPSADPETEAARRERRARLEAALHRLPVPQRQILTMALEGLSQREMADVLGITENNAAVRLSRARGALRQALDSAGGAGS